MVEGQLPEPMKYFVTVVKLTAILQGLLNWVIQFRMGLTNNNSLVKNKSWFYFNRVSYIKSDFVSAKPFFLTNSIIYDNLVSNKCH